MSKTVVYVEPSDYFPEEIRKKLGLDDPDEKQEPSDEESD